MPIASILPKSGISGRCQQRVPYSAIAGIKGKLFRRDSEKPFKCTREIVRIIKTDLIGHFLNHLIIVRQQFSCVIHFAMTQEARRCGASETLEQSSKISTADITFGSQIASTLQSPEITIQICATALVLTSSLNKSG